MNRLRMLFCAAAIACLGMTSASFGIAGVGAHWGFDLTLNMKDKVGESLDFLKLDVALLDSIPGFDHTQLNPALQGVTQITGADVPVYIDRVAWKRSPVNFGGKFYVDVLPVVDAMEFSVNFGMWEYQGSVRYPKRITVDRTATTMSKALVVQDTTVLVTLESLHMPSYFGLLQGTPYAKLHFDATVRKTLLALPPVVKIVKIYAGGGPSVHFATPMLSTSLIRDALNTSLTQTTSLSDINDVLANPVDMKKVLNKITTSLFTPHYGMHLVAGLSLKFPVLPVGFYVDGKYMILFGKMDKNVDIGGNGFLVNTGVTFGL